MFRCIYQHRRLDSRHYASVRLSYVIYSTSATSRHTRYVIYGTAATSRHTRYVIYGTAAISRHARYVIYSTSAKSLFCLKLVIIMHVYLFTGVIRLH